MESIAALVVAVISAMFAGFNTLDNSKHKKNTKKQIDEVVQENKDKIIALEIKHDNTKEHIELLRKDIKEVNKKLDRLLEKGK
ncbi:hypothetical protein mflW37_5760 [Mesoplasma florum W37]|uniref:Uncharacterized protein n=1 Tax=Mesoplasma florum TaxID=2151 RepID=A0AAD0MPV7_MESFO|nr:hypothetical protein [Mesoplasma florum]AGY41643.1 hypothetical protein mflW37_5760 [Mesoplasma florum W37]AVN59848.1 hypothetical protein CG008_03050 [Mesoplasma florum]AVN65981.1 hypothetical protein MflW12_5760 [Mesoplasma florum]